jgi:hypothetical protein
VYFLLLASAPRAAEPALVKLAVSEGRNIAFSHYPPAGFPHMLFKDGAGILWLSTENGLHRLDSATGTFRHHSRYWTDPASLSSTVVRSTFEDPQRTFVAWTTRVRMAGSGSD